MYLIIVSERKERKFRSSRMLAEEVCRISALSSADYCLHDREELDWGHFAFRGSKKEIRRLFEAENLNSTTLDKLSEGAEYTVTFLGCPRLRILQPCAG